LVQIPFVLLAVTLIIFGLMHLTPGDPVQLMLGMDFTPEAAQELRERYHLDRPLHEQYLLWSSRAIQGDLGASIRQSLPVTEMIAKRFPFSLQLASLAMLFALLVAIPAGIISAVRRNTWVDYLLTGVTISGLSIPNFALALLLIYVFALKLEWFPITGIGSTNRDGSLWGAFSPLVLPALALGAYQMAAVSRLLRSSMLDVLNQDYIRTATSKGLRYRAVVVGHALKNALIPVVTVIAIQFGYMVGLTITIEFIFGIPGMGSAMLEAVVTRDFPVVQGFTLFMAVFFILANLVADVLYTILDPRITYR
jgi:ABC-type dipeptide/oligopeptide/nickel transport system permease component